MGITESRRRGARIQCRIAPEQIPAQRARVEGISEEKNGRSEERRIARTSYFGGDERGRIGALHSEENGHRKRCRMVGWRQVQSRISLPGFGYEQIAYGGVFAIAAGRNMDVRQG